MSLFAPAGTPDDVVQKLTAALADGLRTPQAKETAEGAGIQIRYQDPQQLGQDPSRPRPSNWSKVIKTAGIVAN